jgi:peptidoglycan hydrolase-like protein with peptidoglycan-binding domain
MRDQALSTSGIDIRIAFLVIAMAVFTFALPAQSRAATTCTFTTDLTLGVQNEAVRCLQQYLNASGYTVSTSGVGSKGSETNQYREKTQDAVRKWQAANSIPATGTFGPQSRAKYLALTRGGGTTPATPTPSLPPTSSAPAVAARNALTRAIQAYQDAFKSVDEEEVVDILSSAQTELFRAFNAFLSADYANATVLSISAERLANNASKNSDSDDDDDEDSDDIEDDLEEAKDDLDDARDEVDEANEDGEDTDEADDLLEDAEDALDEAEEALDDDDEDEAEDLIDEARDLIDEALDEIGSNSGSDEDDAEDALEDVEKELDRAWEKVEEANDDGEDTDDAEDLLEEAEDLLEEAEEAFDDEDYDEVMDLVKDIEDLIDEALDEI